ncbi:metal-dependent hydrolase [Tateyamaria armeniaca]|uniref:Metal-dependent hydrolase n=1 Tax=Tateyamaria armeniaca TaxID=2518930 RepID=A0ABW8UTH2_9RHOB
MIIGHIAAGYLAARGMSAAGAGVLFAGIIVGSVLPDLDMLWFLLVDQGQVHHHNYVTHRPALWAAVLFVATMSRLPTVAGVAIGALLHLLLDSIVGKIAWGWPVWDVAVPLVVVPATHDNWVLSFLFHWTFAVEWALCAVALVLFAYGRSRVRKTNPD